MHVLTNTEARSRNQIVVENTELLNIKTVSLFLS